MIRNPLHRKSASLRDIPVVTRPASLLQPTSAKSSSTQAGQERTYYYDVDIHGQLFLSAAKHRNVATAYRDVRFLDTFYARIRRNVGIDSEEAQAARRKGYEYVSECMGEMNYVRPDKEGTGLVFQALEGSDLRYAGSLTHPFDPTALRVDSATGYLYHPSPLSRRTKRSHFGPYSLLRSSLVLEHLSESLELEADPSAGGSYEFEGKRYRLANLQPGDVWRRQTEDPEAAMEAAAP